MLIKDMKDFVAGVLFCALGGGFLVGALGYAPGVAARMGPGYFPRLLSAALICVGLALVLKSLRGQMRGLALNKQAVRPLIFILGANTVFALLIAGNRFLHIPPAGLFIAVFATTVFSSFANKTVKLKQRLVLGILLASISCILFVFVLKLPFTLWPRLLYE